MTSQFGSILLCLVAPFLYGPYWVDWGDDPGHILDILEFLTHKMAFFEGWFVISPLLVDRLVLAAFGDSILW